MRNKLISTIVAIGSLVSLPAWVLADPDPALNAKQYSVTLVQAMDECGSAVTNVDGVGACPTANVDTDGAHFRMGRITIKSKFGPRQILTQIRSNGANPPNLANRLVHTLIVLRVTRTNQAPLVTWVDQLLECPDIAVPSNGNAIQKTNFVDCGLPASLANDSTNKEVIAVRIVDSITGEAIAVPGVRRK